MGTLSNILSTRSNVRPNEGQDWTGMLYFLVKLHLFIHITKSSEASDTRELVVRDLLYSVQDTQTLL